MLQKVLFDTLVVLVTTGAPIGSSCLSHIPTTADLLREAMLRRAISSAGSAQVIVVVNGDRFDPLLVDSLRADKSLVVLQRDEGNVSAARRAGLDAVTTAFFCFLDDDDELLPDALESRMRSIRPDDDILVTNGYCHDGVDRPLVEMAAGEINADPIGSFLRQNWFASPAGLFRTAAIPKQMFDIRLAHFEWTWLFFQLQTAGIRMRYTDDLTYRIHTGTLASASKSAEYAASYAPLLRSLLALPLPPRHRRTLLRKYQVALNGASLAALRAGTKSSAWAVHARCLATGGWRYLPYTRHLLKPK